MQDANIEHSIPARRETPNVEVRGLLLFTSFPLPLCVFATFPLE